MAPSPRQANFIRDLLRDRQPDEHLRVEALDVIERGTGRQASGILDRLKNAPRVVSGGGNTGHSGGMKVTEPGVYRHDGEVFIVKVTKATAKLDPSEWKFTASRLVETGGTRVTEAGTFVNVDYEYARGAVWTLSPSDRMPFEDAQALTARYGRCIVCGAYLKDAKSVEAGIGPVCRKRFPDAAITAPRPVERVGDDDGQAWIERAEPVEDAGNRAERELVEAEQAAEDRVEHRAYMAGLI